MHRFICSTSCSVKQDCKSSHGMPCSQHRRQRFLSRSHVENMESASQVRQTWPSTCRKGILSCMSIQKRELEHVSMHPESSRVDLVPRLPSCSWILCLVPMPTSLS